MILEKHPHDRLLRTVMRTKVAFYGPAPVPVTFLHDDIERGFLVHVPMPVFYAHGVPVGVGHTWLFEVKDNERKLIEVVDKLALYSIESGLTYRELLTGVDGDVLSDFRPQAEQLQSCLTFEPTLQQCEEIPLKEIEIERVKLSQLMNRTGFKPWS